MKKEMYELADQMDAAEIQLRNLLIRAARYQAEADRAARMARAFEHKIVRMQKKLEELEGEAMQ